MLNILDMAGKHIKINFTCFFLLFKYVLRKFKIIICPLQSIGQCCYRQKDLTETQLEINCVQKLRPLTIPSTRPVYKFNQSLPKLCLLISALLPPYYKPQPPKF